MAGDMRIALIGQQAFGKAVLEALLDRGENVIAVYCAPDKGRVDPLRETALQRNVPLFQPPSFKKPDVWEAFGHLKPDLGVMAFVTLFVPEEFLYIPAKGTIQYHPSLLPRHRGPSSINWPIIQGATKTGLSIFWPDNGLDTGPVLMQKEAEIGENDTLGTVYFDKLFPLGVQAMLESVDLVRAGKAPKVKQDESKKTYESWCKAENAEIDWKKPAAEVHNLIRGTDPAPGAWSRLGEKVVQLFGSSKTGRTGGAPGEVAAVGPDGIVIACADGQVRLTRARAEGGQKLEAGAFAASVGLKPGARFGA